MSLDLWDMHLNIQHIFWIKVNVAVVSFFVKKQHEF